MCVALKLEVFQVWGGVDLVRRTTLVSADGFLNSHPSIVGRSNQMPCHCARILHDIGMLNQGHVIVCKHASPLLQAYSYTIDQQRFQQSFVRFRLTCVGPGKPIIIVGPMFLQNRSQSCTCVRTTASLKSKIPKWSLPCYHSYPPN